MTVGASRGSATVSPATNDAGHRHAIRRAQVFRTGPPSPHDHRHARAECHAEQESGCDRAASRATRRVLQDPERYAGRQPDNAARPRLDLEPKRCPRPYRSHTHFRGAERHRQEARSTRRRPAPDSRLLARRVASCSAWRSATPPCARGALRAYGSAEGAGLGSARSRAALGGPSGMDRRESLRLKQIGCDQIQTIAEPASRDPLLALSDAMRAERRQH